MNIEALGETAVLALAVGAASMTITRTKIFKPFRLAVFRRSRWFGDLLQCPYCVSHWLALASVLTYQPQIVNSPHWTNAVMGTVLNIGVSWLVVVALATWVGGLIRHSYNGMVSADQQEIEDMLNGGPHEGNQEGTGD